MESWTEAGSLIQAGFYTRMKDFRSSRAKKKTEKTAGGAESLG